MFSTGLGNCSVSFKYSGDSGSIESSGRPVSSMPFHFWTTCHQFLTSSSVVSGWIFIYTDLSLGLSALMQTSTLFGNKCGASILSNKIKYSIMFFHLGLISKCLIDHYGVIWAAGEV